MASPIFESVQSIDYNCRRYYLPPENLTLHNLTHSLTPKTALIQQFKLLQLILKEGPQKRDQQLKRGEKKRRGRGVWNTDRGYNSTKLKEYSRIEKHIRVTQKWTTWQKLSKIFVFAFYAFKLISTFIEILIIYKPQGFWHTFKTHTLSFSKSPVTS